MMFEAACSKLGCPEADTCRPNTEVFSVSWTDAAKPLPDGLADHDAGVRIGHSLLILRDSAGPIDLLSSL